MNVINRMKGRPEWSFILDQVIVLDNAAPSHECALEFPLVTFGRPHHFIVMRRQVQDIRELLRSARILRWCAQDALERRHMENLLRVAEELEGRARILANARPGEVVDVHKEEALHVPVDVRV